MTATDNPAPKPQLGSDNHKTSARPGRPRKRTRVLEGDGDYRVMVVAEGSSTIPKGSLIPLEGAPGFETMAEAKKWIRKESGDALVGKMFAIVKFAELGQLKRVEQPSVRLDFKPRRVIQSEPEH